MPLSLKPVPRHQRGATRRRNLPIDRWLNCLLDIAVLSAVLVGGAALFSHFFLGD